MSPASIRPASLRGREQGRRAFILGNGPSILQQDLGLLRGQLVIGMNASPILDRQHGFTSAYYCVSDLRFLDVPAKRLMATDLPDATTIRVMRAECAAVDGPTLAHRTCYVTARGRDGFSNDLAAGFYFGSTTALLALQLAHHLGCGSAALLGCDYTYPSGQPRFYPEDTPCPADPMVSVQVRNMAEGAARLSAMGMDVINCSASSMLRSYIPTFSLEDALAGPRLAHVPE